jgi:hypothetical protein
MPLMHRRALLAVLPAPLVLRPRAAPAGIVPPAFTGWIDRTALLRTDQAPARLHLAPDGTGTLATRLGLCWTVPVRRWRIGGRGLLLDYVRRSALDPDREIEGKAEIDPAAGLLAWSETGTRREAELLALEPGDTTGAC